MPVVLGVMFGALLFFGVLLLASFVLWWTGRSSDEDRTPRMVEARQRLLFKVEGVVAREGFTVADWSAETERCQHLKAAGYPRAVTLTRLETLLAQTKVPSDTNQGIRRDELRALVDAAKSLILRKRLRTETIRNGPVTLEALERLEKDLGDGGQFYDDEGIPIDPLSVELGHRFRAREVGFEHVEARTVQVGDEISMFSWSATGRAVDFNVAKPGRVASASGLDDRYFMRIDLEDGRSYKLDGYTYVMRRRAAA